MNVCEKSGVGLETSWKSAFLKDRIARRTLSGERTVDEAREAFIGRLGALADTYSMLTKQNRKVLR